MRAVPRTSRWSRALCLAVGGALWCAPSLAAQERPARDSSVQRIEPREVRADRSAIVTGGAAGTVVRLDSVRAGAAPTLADLLRSTGLVQVRTNSRGEAELLVRGSESRQISVMLNGMPLSPGWDGRADASLIPLSGVSALTVVRSTGSLLGGPNAIGGVVDLQVDPVARGGERELTIGSDQTGARLASVSVGGASPVGARGSTHWRAGGGYRARDGLVRARRVPDPSPGAALRTNTDIQSRDIFAAVGWDGVRGAAVHALVTAYDAERGVAPELHLTAPRLWRYPEQARALVQVRATAPLAVRAASATTLEASLGVIGGRTRIETFSDDAFRTVTGREAGDEMVRSARVSVAHTRMMGAEVRGALTVNDIRFDETLVAGVPDRFGQRLVSSGIEAQRILRSQTLLTAGVVLDHGATTASAGRAAAPARTEPGWRVGATTALGPALRAHASASARSRFPALRELYSGALARFEPNPALRPERLRSLEGGISAGAVESGQGLGVQVVGFHHQLSDGIVRVGFEGTDRFQRINRDRSNAIGSEVLIGWRGDHGRSLRLDVMGQQVRVRDASLGTSGRKPEHMPGVRATLDATTRVRGGVQLGSALTYFGSQYCVNPETTRDESLAAQAVASVTAQRAWSLRPGGVFQRLRLLLGVDNLGDRAVYEQCGLPQGGRTLRLSLSFE
jgi:iron complex outermembrane recepter protein